MQEDTQTRWSPLLCTFSPFLVGWFHGSFWSARLTFVMHWVDLLFPCLWLQGFTVEAQALCQEQDTRSKSSTHSLVQVDQPSILFLLLFSLSLWFLPPIAAEQHRSPLTHIHTSPPTCTTPGLAQSSMLRTIHSHCLRSSPSLLVFLLLWVVFGDILVLRGCHCNDRHVV